MQNTDVLILGGGPAGASLAIMLLKRQPSRRVLLVEKSDYQAPRIGETLHPKIADLMNPLGIWEAFQAEGHLPAPGTAAFWGSDQQVEHDFIFQTGGKGWHLDRNRFDRFLVKTVKNQGARVHLNASATLLETRDGQFLFEIKNKTDKPQQVQTRFVVDATGRPAAFATQMGAGKVRFDNLCGLFRFYEISEKTAETNTLVESWENGWWYSAQLPDNKLVVACMTDSDLVERKQLHEAGWEQLLEAAPHTRKRLKRALPTGAAQVWPAASQCPDMLFGPGWLAVGDAAGTFAPLSAQGIFKAMKSGIFGAYAALDYLDGKTEALPRYEKLIRSEYENYLDTRSQYYQQEQRWSDSPFWQRRLGWISLEPTAKLVAAAGAPATERANRYFLSRQAEAAICSICRQPRTAAEVVDAFKKPPFDYKTDRNCILGLQYLLEIGVLVRV